MAVSLQLSSFPSLPSFPCLRPRLASFSIELCSPTCSFLECSAVLLRLIDSVQISKRFSLSVIPVSDLLPVTARLPAPITETLGHCLNQHRNTFVSTAVSLADGCCYRLICMRAYLLFLSRTYMAAQQTTFPICVDVQP